MKQPVILKLIGLSLLTMIVLVLISILEVAIYSYLINPGQTESNYEAHAEQTAPYISGIFGFIIFFFVGRYWTKKNYENVARLVILFPLTYVLIDLAIIVLAVNTGWKDYVVIFLLANGAKFLGSYLGYKVSAKQNTASQVL